MVWHELPRHAGTEPAACLSHRRRYYFGFYSRDVLVFQEEEVVLKKLHRYMKLQGYLNYIVTS